METKTFDSVAMMRELRDRLSQEMAEMTPVERLRYVRKMAAATPLGDRLQQQAGESAPVPPSQSATTPQ